MTDVEQQKKQIYNLLFYDWNPDAKSQVRSEIMTLIQHSFGTKEKQSMSLAELNFNIQHTVRNLIDYIEISIPEVDLKYASKVAEKFVIKALKIAPLWKQLKSMGVLPDNPLNDMVWNMKHEPKRKGVKTQKNPKQIRIKTERYAAKPVVDMSDDMMELQREIARQQGFDICNTCRLRTPLSEPKCIHCDS